MQTLYLTDPQDCLVKVGQTVRLLRDGRPVARVWLSSLRQVFLFGPIQLPAGTLQALAAAGVPVVFLTGHGRFLARLEGPPGGAPSLRRAQYLQAEDPDWTLENARAVLMVKLLGSIGLLRRHLRNHDLPELRGAIEELQKMRRQLRQTPSLPRLRGLEGRAGALYFQQWGLLLRADLPFTRRTRRPAADPVNALLGLVYGLLRIEIESHLTGLGLDPRVGFLHVQRGQRCSLALDLLEEFRAEVGDRLVLRCFNLGSLKEHHFQETATGACHLTREGRGIFLAAYEKHQEKPWRDLRRKRTNYRRLVHVQCREMVAAIREGRCYRPHQPRI